MTCRPWSLKITILGTKQVSRKVGAYHGAVQYKGKLIDAASIRMVQNIIDQADLIGM